MSERADGRVLVIDDDELSREVLEVLLCGDGYEVDVAGSGDEALLALEKSGAKPDVVLMDMQMPGVCGGQLARRLRSACGDEVRVIAMSGSRPAEADSEVFDGFLLKPFSIAEFAEVLDRLECRSPERGNDTMSRKRDKGLPASDSGSSSACLDEEVLDPQIFRGFAGMMQKKPLRDLYALCVNDAWEQLAAMRAASAAGNAARFRASAHAMKGSFGMVGARELQTMCALLERADLADDYVATLAKFPAAIGRLQRMLNARGVDIQVTTET